VDKRLYRFLVWTAIALTLAWVGWSLYDSMIGPRNPGDMAYLEANKLFEDGAYQRALDKYDEALNANPDHIFALRGRARSLMELGRPEQALAAFDAAISLAPDFGATYANRGILHDRTGRYEKAIEDYTRALELDPELAKGPHWLVRFLRNQPQKPPGIAERAAYLREELAKPENERLLKVPEMDAEQRSYRQ
jgi:tetratricopeptide (TPR) repeat protein